MKAQAKRSMLALACVGLAAMWLLESQGIAQPLPAELAAHADPRPPKDDEELRYWLTNMLCDHRFSDAEAAAATGLSPDEVAAASKRLGIAREPVPRGGNDNLRVLPYPGGRHPRIGFLDGAVRPQRETKVSVVAPWDDRSYVVIDVPEAIWCQHGLLYLAHTHVATIWTEHKVELEKLEWKRLDGGHLEIERTLPNDVAFGSRVTPRPDGVRMACWLTNGSQETMTNLRVQMCAMLKGLDGFAEQTNDNKLFRGDYACCRSTDGKRWVIMAWTPNQRTWGNAPCPCLHSDPQFPDCAAGETVWAAGQLWFYEGEAIEEKLNELESSGWRERKPAEDDPFADDSLPPFDDDAPKEEPFGTDR